MKVLVNGATGLVGLAMVDAFLEAGMDVRASDRPGSDFSELEKREVEIIPAELDDPEALERTVEGMEGIAHVAGLFDLGASRELLDRVNHQGTRKVCEAALKKAPNLQRFLQVASVGVYGNPVRCPCREDDPKRPHDGYERSKYLGELAAFEYHLKHGLPVTSIRPTLIYGPRARYGHAMFIAVAALFKDKGWPFLRFKKAPRSAHVHVEDVGRAAALLMKHPNAVGKSYNVTDPNPMEGDVFLQTLGESVGLEMKPLLPHLGPLMTVSALAVNALPGSVNSIYNRKLESMWDEVVLKHGLVPALRFRWDPGWWHYMTGDIFFDVTALKEAGMEWKWPDAAEGLKKTIEWYKENRWIPA